MPLNSALLVPLSRHIRIFVFTIKFAQDQGISNAHREDFNQTAIRLHGCVV